MLMLPSLGNWEFWWGKDSWEQVSALPWVGRLSPLEKEGEKPGCDLIYFHSPPLAPPPPHPEDDLA